MPSSCDRFPVRGPSSRWARRAFTVTELIVVILIITLVISILIPAIGTARAVARASSSRSFISQITQSSESFRLDKRRYPGYFSQAAMGSISNGGAGTLPGQLSRSAAGLSAAENVMLDLASSEAIFSEDAEDRVLVSPINDDNNPAPVGVDPTQRQIYVNPGLIGAGSNAYFTPSGEFYVAQTTNFDADPLGNGVKQNVDPRYGHAAGPGQLQLPDLVDAFGTPILIWVADRDSVPELRNPNVDLAAIEEFGHRHSERPDRPAMFNWNSNAAFLRANSLGEGGANMNVSPFSQATASLIGAGALAEVEGRNRGVYRLLSAFFGAPAYPFDEFLRDGSNAYEFVFPSQPRGDFIVHSAGRDQVYFGNRDRAFRSYVSGQNFSGNTFELTYGLNFGPAGGSPPRWEDDAGKPTTIDFASEFDDILVSTN